MVFCGQCGFHLPAGVTRCPRCGAVADTPSTDTSDASFSSDAPTMASLTYTQRPQSDMYSDASHASMPFTPHEQQKLVLRSGDYSTGVAGSDEPTSAMVAPDYRTRTPVDYQTHASLSSGVSHAGYPAQDGNTYQSRRPNYATNLPPGGAAPVDYPLTAPVQRKKRRTLPLLLAVLGVLLLIGVSAFFVATRLHLLDIPGTSTTPVSRVEQAKSVVRQYYDDINNKNYQDAYGLWKWDTNAPSFAAFQNGYANTEHDDLTIRDATQQSDGTVRVLLTIVATERIGGKQQQHTYVGYYIVGQDAGTWKILHGVLDRV